MTADNVDSAIDGGSSTGDSGCSFTIVSSITTGRSAIAIVELRGNVSSALAAINTTAPPIGAAALRKIPNIDDLVVARLSDRLVFLFPHAGVRVIARLVDALIRAGCVESPFTLATEYASRSFDERLSKALARAQSPLAINVLLSQRARWTSDCEPLVPEHDDRSRSALKRLITPPLVAALGHSNIGKSSLLNALAGRHVALVADAPGTTRDHVGVHLNLGGLVVRYLDTPGVDAVGSDDFILREAQQTAMSEVAQADVLLLCTDSTSPCVAPPSGFAGNILRVGVRSDLGPARSAVDVGVCVQTGEGVTELVKRIVETLLPSALLESPLAWAFWDC